MRVLLILLIWATGLTAFGAAPEKIVPFPPALDSYGDAGEASLWKMLRDRVAAEPFNLVATLIFLCAIIHTFLAPKIMHLSHHWRDEHRRRLERQGKLKNNDSDAPEEVSFKAEITHFFGEIEAVFGIWVIPLLLAMIFMKDWTTAQSYMNHKINFTEPMFVVVIMTIAATRPVLRAAEQGLGLVANLMGGSVSAWWLSILTVGPLFGSFITEPAAMTICALLLARKLYEFRPSPKLSYATIGLLFVNISIGGTLTHFAAPPVLMVAGKWGWGMSHMFLHFGWKAIAAIVVSNLTYWIFFRNELACLSNKDEVDRNLNAGARQHDFIPPFVTITHFAFLAWTVFTAHEPVFFIGGFLIFVAFTEATEHHQDSLALRPALLVGFFLAGLVIHGGLQGWWIAPVLSQFGERGLMFTAIILTAFNDNAAITYLASLVPNLNEALKHAVVAGAVVGGGLTVIANAPNPAGQSVLSKYFPHGLSPLYLFLGAALPTAIAALAFLLFR